MERRTKPNLLDTSAKVGVQLAFVPHRRYRLSVAVWWYILVRFWIGSFASYGLIQAETTVCRKASTWSNGSKDGNKIKIKLE